MNVTALVMAGGRGLRMNLKEEKPLVKVNGKSLIEHVIGALRNSNKVKNIIITVSIHTPKTAERVKSLSIKLLETPGDGYIGDMKYAFKKLELEKGLVISADLPMITGRMIDEVISIYEKSEKPALSVMCPIEVFNRLGLEPRYTSLVEGRVVSPVGMNIIDGSSIDDEKIDELQLVLDDEKLAFNINTVEDIENIERWKRNISS